MKTSPRFAAACAALLSLAAVSAPASVAVQNITIQFTTLEDGKAPGSAVSVFIQNSVGAVVAGNYDFARGALPGKSTSPEFTVPITHGPVTSDQMSAFKVTIQMQSPPGKSDTWQFTYVIKIHMANGGTVTRQVAPCLLKSTSGGAASVFRDIHL